MTRQTDGKSLYEQQEERILAQSDAFISLLTKRGILGDHQIDNEKVRKAKQEKNRKSYVCSNFPECDAYVRVHAGTNIPVGSLANHELRSLRRTAHHYFDQLHLSGYMSKQDAYKWLADLVMAPMSEAHIGHLGEYYCKLVIEESRKLLDRPRKMKSSPRFQVLQGGAAAS